MLFDREELKKLVQEKGVKTTKDLDGLLKELTGEIIGALYEGEMRDHLGYDKYDYNAKQISNSRNGYSPKTVQSKHGEIELKVPRDRNGEFEPKIVKKRQKDITGMEEKVISMYGLGLSTRDIRYHIDEIYGYDMSPEQVSIITDTVIERAREWQNRPLKEIYAMVYMDALVVKMKVEGISKNIAVYGLIGIDLDGNKECLGLYISKEPESAKYWLSVMTELKNRDVKDILIFAVDNLTGISEAIEAAFPKSDIQKCVVHQIRNSLKYVPYKERKAVAGDLKSVYKAGTEEAALEALKDFDKLWGKKYPHIVKSWKKNWDELSTMFKYPPEIRKLIYTTNPIESFNRQLRKVSKNKSVFPNEDAVLKLFYLAVEKIHKRWNQRIRDWGIIYSQLAIMFEDRIQSYL